MIPSLIRLSEAAHAAYVAAIDAGNTELARDLEALAWTIAELIARTARENIAAAKAVS